MEQIKDFRYNDLVLYCKGWYEGTDDIFADFERYIKMNGDYCYPKQMTRKDVITHALRAVDLVFNAFTKEERHNHYLGTMSKFYDYTMHKMWVYNIKDFEVATLFVVHEFLQGLDRYQMDIIPPTYGKNKPKLGWGYKFGMTYKEMNNMAKAVFKK